MPEDPAEFDSVSKQYNFYAISAVDPGELLCGRQYEGLTIIWRKSINHLSRIVTFDDIEFMGLWLISLVIPFSSLMSIYLTTPSIM